MGYAWISRDPADCPFSVLLVVNVVKPILDFPIPPNPFPAPQSSLRDNLMPFEIGDVVRLKSGGPRMTVVDQSMDQSMNSFQCAWFDGAELKAEWFRTEIIEKSTAPDLSAPPFLDPQGN